MKTKFYLLIIILVCLIVYACVRKDVYHIDKSAEQNAAVKEWLQKKGGRYRSGSMIVQAPTGIILVKLDWAKAKKITWHERNFLDVPYILDNGSRYAPGADGKGAAAFNLVVHLYQNGDYRAAIRTTSYDGSTSENSKRILQSYQMLNGRPMNVWYKDSKKRNFVTANRLNINEEQFLLLKKMMNQKKPGLKSPANSRIAALSGLDDDDNAVPTEGGVRIYDSANCTITETTMYHDCDPTGSGGSPGDGEYSDPVVVATCPYVERVIVCEMEDPVGGVGGGGGLGGGGSDPVDDGTGDGTNNNNGDCSDVAPPPPPPTNPDGTSAPYDPPTPCEVFPPEDQPQPDPCATTQAQNATNITKKAGYSSGLNAVKNAASDGKEHSVALNQSADGELSYTPVTNGSETSTSTQIGSNTVADIHNHPTAKPPSAGDVYSLIKSNGTYSSFGTEFVVMPGGSVYALVITSQTNAADFLINYPPFQIQGYPPDFTATDDKNLADIYNNTFQYFRSEGQSNEEANAGALAYILDNYNSGVALLKMRSDGTFTKINTVKTGGSGINATFDQNDCLN